MATEKPSLGYKDEKDRCYGATGMAIGIVVVDGEDYIDHITIDGPADRMVEYTGDFFYSGNPGVSAKLSWNHILRNYNLSVIAMLSNVLCRTMIHENMPVRYEVKQMLHDIAFDEGREYCQLEDDELESIFNKNYDYLYSVFNHRGVKSLADDFAALLLDRRTLSRLEILEQLKALSMF